MFPSTRTRTISERLADYVVNLRYEDVPDSVIDKAKDLLVHHIGAALRGHGFARAQQAVGVAFELSGVDARCSIMVERRRADLLEAIFANSSLMDCVGLDDHVLPPGLNPGVIIQPTAWAVGEATGASGRELLTAVVVGYDVLVRLGRPVWTWRLEVDRGAKSVVGPVGGAATAARLLGLSREQTTHALGHAGHAAMGIAEETEQRGIMYPLLARNGAMAAMLARAGMPASPTIIEGPHGVYRSFCRHDVPDSFYDSLATLGREFEICKAATRRYPVSAMNHIPIELAERLVTTQSLTPDRIAAVDLVLPEERKHRKDFYPATHYARPSFLIAVILTDGQTDTARFFDRPDTETLNMLQRLRLRFERGRPLHYARIEVTATDGQQYIAESDTYVPPAIDWTEWLSDGGRHAILSEDQLTRLAELIRNLEDVPNVAEVMACVAPASRHDNGRLDSPSA